MNKQNTCNLPNESSRDLNWAAHITRIRPFITVVCISLRRTSRRKEREIGVKRVFNKDKKY